MTLLIGFNGPGHCLVKISSTHRNEPPNTVKKKEYRQVERLPVSDKELGFIETFQRNSTVNKVGIFSLL